MARKSIILVVAMIIAATGAGLVFLYVSGVDNRAQADAAPLRVLTATQTVEAGESVTDAQDSGKLALTDVPGTAVLSGALTDTEGLDDQVALAPIYAGEQIVAAKFGQVGSQSRITIPPKMMAISVQLTDPQRVAGFVSPGSYVAVFSSAGAGTGEVAQQPAVRLLLPEVQVIGVGQAGVTATTTTDDTGGQTTEQIPTTILTLALDQADAERVILASAQSDLTLGLLTDKSAVRSTTGTSLDQLFS